MEVGGEEGPRVLSTGHLPDACALQFGVGVLTHFVLCTAGF